MPKSASATFEQGNAQLLRGHYAQAIGPYQQLVRQGVERSELYCNTGNAFYRTGQVGWAIYYYEKGLSLAPLDAQLLANREAALTKAGTQHVTPHPLPTPSQLVLVQVADWVARLAVLGLVGSGMLFLSNAIARQHPQREKLLAWCRYVLLSSGLALGLAGGLIFSFEHHGAVIVQAKATGRAGPSPAARPVFEAKAGDRVAVKNRYQQWLKVQTPSGEEGWIMAASAASLAR